MFVKKYWRTLFVFLVPLLFCPLPIHINTSEARCGYVIIIMAALWMTEAIPTPATSLIPVFAFPFLGILSTDQACRVYMKASNMMFLGSLIISTAVEHCNLHERIALFIILHVGQSPLRLMAGFMMTTMFLSMWISNTASTAMMVPIVEAILQELYRVTEQKIRQTYEHKNKAEEETTESSIYFSEPPDDECRNIRDMVFLATAYGANLGGTGSMTGTGSNLVLKGVLQEFYPNQNDLSFPTWILYNVPGMVVCGILAWAWLQILFGGCRSRERDSNEEEEEEIRKLILRRYKALGRMTFHEIIVLILFVIVVLLWFFLEPNFMTGWGQLFINAFGESTNIDDASSSLFIVFLLFAIPSLTDSPSGKPGTCLSWKVIQEKVPWGVVFIMGGGYAIAEGSKKSGLSEWLGNNLAYMQDLPPSATVFLVSFIVAMLTEVVSNAAVASLMLPILMQMATAIKMNPLYLSLPATLACSYAFMLPVATPPNAIVYGIKAGIVMNIICILVLTFMINTLGDFMFNFRGIPDWAITNSTSVV